MCFSANLGKSFLTHRRSLLFQGDLRERSPKRSPKTLLPIQCISHTNWSTTKKKLYPHPPSTKSLMCHVYTEQRSASTLTASKDAAGRAQWRTLTTPPAKPRRALRCLSTFIIFPKSSQLKLPNFTLSNRVFSRFPK